MNFFNRSIKPSLIKAPYNQNIEAYRGLCALLVVLNHGLVQREILIDNLHIPTFLLYINSPYLSVLVFFCISGYAIGVSTNKKDLNILNYLKKRAVRLYPILIIATGVCILAVQHFPVMAIISNLLFLQNNASYFGWQVNTFVNFPIWSLNYEALYYLLFIVIFLIKPRLWILLTLMGILSLISITTATEIGFLPNYLNGFYFWLLGLCIAWGLISNTTAPQKINLLSLLFLHLSMTHLGIGSLVMNFIGQPSNNNFPAVFFLPFCLMVITTLTGYNNKILRINTWVCYLLPAVVFTYLAFTNRIFENERWIMCLVFWALSLLFYNEHKISALILKRLRFFGEISYGLYLFHVPIAILIKQYVHVSSNEALIKYTLWITLTLLLSYLAEKIIQPVIRSYFLKDVKNLPVLPQQA